MYSLRLHDPDRVPPSWADIVRPGQILVFASLLASEAPCDPSGRAFSNPEEAICLVFEELEEAVGFCEARVADNIDVAFEIFDSAGRAHLPLLRVVHASRASRLTGRGSVGRKRAVVAAVLTAGAIPLFWIDWRAGGGLILPTFIGINLILAAVRLLFLNLVSRDRAAREAERLAAHRAGAAGRPRQ